MELNPTYSQEDIKRYMSDIRLAISDEGGNVDDAESLKKIEEYVFSLKKA